MLILDGLNQLDAEAARSLTWFPWQLPPEAHVSTLPGPCLDRFRDRLPADNVIELAPLSASACQELAQAFLGQRGKRLTESQLNRLFDLRVRPDAALPLYALVALEEMTVAGRHEDVDRRIDALPATLPELYDQVLARLEVDHGTDLTSGVCRWLVASRNGLQRLYRALAFHLRPMDEETQQRGGYIDFFHDQIRQAVVRRYWQMNSVSGPATDLCRASHRELANYFEKQRARFVAVAARAGIPAALCLETADRR